MTLSIEKEIAMLHNCIQNMVIFCTAILTTDPLV